MRVLYILLKGKLLGIMFLMRMFKFAREKRVKSRYLVRLRLKNFEKNVFFFKLTKLNDFSRTKICS